MSYDRAWASVGYALSRPGFTSLENQKELGYYLLEYQEPSEDSEGWWSRMFSFGEKGNPVVAYKISLEEVNGKIVVRVQNADGASMTQRENYTALQLVRNNLG